MNLYLYKFNLQNNAQKSTNKWTRSRLPHCAHGSGKGTKKISSLNKLITQLAHCKTLTMATPSDTPGGAHHHRHHHHHHHRKPPLCQEDDSPEKPLYRNIKPKVGHLYQTKVPKLGAALSTRPTPQAYSNEMPHLTVNQVNNNEEVDKGEIRQ